MQISNERLAAYDTTTKNRDKFPVFNGQIGTVVASTPRRCTSPAKDRRGRST